jgi:DNA-binding transcriptional MocR family regulator
LPARHTHPARSNAIRDILTTAATPDMLSLTGAIPTPESLPTPHLQRTLDKMTSRTPTQALQNAPTNGIGRHPRRRPLSHPPPKPSPALNRPW